MHRVVCGLMALPREAAGWSSPSAPATTTPARWAWQETTSRARWPSSCAAAHTAVGASAYALHADPLVWPGRRHRAGHHEPPGRRDLQEGEALFVTSALRILSNAREGFPVRASFDGEKTQDLSTIIFAVQVGPSYGGGFKIRPNADPTDGLLDVCYNVKLPALPRLMALLGLARLGRHTGSSVVRLRRCRSLTLDFERETPCQADGEKVCGTHFDVQVAPDATSSSKLGRPRGHAQTERPRPRDLGRLVWFKATRQRMS